MKNQFKPLTLEQKNYRAIKNYHKLLKRSNQVAKCAPNNFNFQAIKHFFDGWSNVLSHLSKVPWKVQKDQPKKTKHRIERKSKYKNKL